MSPACYDGFGDGAGGFFVVYSELFENIDSLERAAATESGSKFSEAPCFGDSKSPVSQVKQFYAHWSNFVSSRSFAWRDKWNLAEGPNRYVRREMEKENKKERGSHNRSTPKHSGHNNGGSSMIYQHQPGPLIFVFLFFGLCLLLCFFSSVHSLPR